MEADCEKIEELKAAIGTFADFPKPGIVFKDIFTALRNGRNCKLLKEVLLNYIKHKYPYVDVIVGLDARGFLFAFMIAAELEIACVPVRKHGKLPGNCALEEYDLEYGKDIIEIQEGSIRKGQKVIIVDDLIATGGTLAAATNLVNRLGGEILECLVIIELVDLKGREKISSKVHSLIQYC